MRIIIAGVISTIVGGIILLMIEHNFFSPDSQSKVENNKKNYTLSNHKQFFLYLYYISKEQKKNLWSDQLSSELKDAGIEKIGSDFIDKHYEEWSAEIVNAVDTILGGNPNNAKVLFIPRKNHKGEYDYDNGIIIVENTPIIFGAIKYAERYFINTAKMGPGNKLLLISPVKSNK